MNWAVYLQNHFPTMYAQYQQELEEKDNDSARHSVDARWAKLTCSMIKSDPPSRNEEAMRKACRPIVASSL
jgi:L-rhamnose mutarotase